MAILNLVIFLLTHLRRMFYVWRNQVDDLLLQWVKLSSTWVKDQLHGLDLTQFKCL